MRAVSTRVDDSTRTTVAPKSASARPTSGPATTQLKSATFSPANGSSVMTPLRTSRNRRARDRRRRPAQLDERHRARGPARRHRARPITVTHSGEVAPRAELLAGGEVGSVVDADAQQAIADCSIEDVCLRLALEERGRQRAGLLHVVVVELTRFDERRQHPPIPGRDAFRARTLVAHTSEEVVGEAAPRRTHRQMELDQPVPARPLL